MSLMPIIGCYMGPVFADMVNIMTETIPNHITQAQQQKSAAGPRVLAQIMDSPIPDEHKTIYRLSGEAWTIVAGASETTPVSCHPTPLTLTDEGTDNYIIEHASRHHLFPAVTA
jgi:hypothetical protein